MNPIYICFVFGIILGAAITWLYKALRFSKHYVPRGEYDKSSTDLIESNRKLSVESEKVNSLSGQLAAKTSEFNRAESERNELNSNLASKRTEIQAIQNKLDGLEESYKELSGKLAIKTDEFDSAKTLLATALAERDGFERAYKAQGQDLEASKKDHVAEMNRANRLAQDCAILDEQVKSHAKNLEAQKGEVERIQKELKNEFQVMASSLLEEKSQKFAQFNKDSIEALLKPLGDNIQGFRAKVEEVYDKESKERFSLGGEVQKLFLLNQKLSEEANNLANALKGNSKTQGDWGQMILENILERSGLVKGRDFEVQEFLKDADGNYIKNEDNRKLQPDVIIHYPDERKVLIDAKVSLTAYVRFTEAEALEDKASALVEHMRSVRKHIDELSAKSYQDYAGASLDFVMMFLPNEPAYCCAMAEDPDLWHYAYGKKVILINPTNLIVALKMTADLWRREHQARNHVEIANRGAMLYDKFVNFVETMKLIGSNLKNASSNYEKAFGQLSDGPGNLIGQAEKLRHLGVKTKKSLPQELLIQAGAAEAELAGEGEAAQALSG